MDLCAELPYDDDVMSMHSGTEQHPWIRISSARGIGGYLTVRSKFYRVHRPFGSQTQQAIDLKRQCGTSMWILDGN